MALHHFEEIEIMILIEFKEISFSYTSDLVVSGLSLELGKFQIVGILGPSGCGKSTVLRLIAGLEKPVEGSILYDGKVKEPPNEGLRFSFQDFDAFPWRTVEENLTLAGATQDEKGSGFSVDELLSKIGLYEHRKKYPAELSGGMQKRLALGRWIAGKPDVVLLDEPFSSLDVDTRYDMYSLLQSLRLTWQCLFIIVTHNIHEAVYLCSEIIVSTPLPFRVKSKFEVPFDYPRTEEIQESGDYIRLVSQVSHEFRHND